MREPSREDFWAVEGNKRGEVRTRARGRRAASEDQLAGGHLRLAVSGCRGRQVVVVHSPNPVAAVTCPATQAHSSSSPR